ncbi:hypothetical protein [Streptomyces violaceus]|uniref:Uncharacterized protein n=1 Tax=Streptomyces violaceus TaxID=1936 RepID=A0ABZ1NS84_STRVL
MRNTLSSYGKERMASAVAEARNWTDLMRLLGLRASGGQRRVLQKRVAELGLDTSHFVKRSPWRKYPDSAIAEAAASSSSLREVALKLGANPATGTLSHIRRRIHAAGIDISHFPGINRPDLDFPFTAEELRAAAAAATSVRGGGSRLGRTGRQPLAGDAEPDAAGPRDRYRALLPPACIDPREQAS